MKQLLFNLSALVDLGHEVTSSREYAERMKTALYVITGMFSIPHAALFIYDAGTGALAFLTGKRVAHLADVRLTIDASDLALLPRNEPVNAQQLRNTGLFKRNADALSKMHATVLVPLYAKEEFTGLIVLGPRLNGSRLVPMEKEVLQVASHQIATAMHTARLFTQINDHAAENRRLYENMRGIYHDTIRAFATAIDAKDQYTKHHSFRVAHLAAAIAHELQWSKSDVEAIYIAGLLHDIGKISLDVDLINKGAMLTTQERDKIKRHAEVSYDIVVKIRLPWKDVAEYIRHHHERPDGRGYPDALQAQDLSDGGKILALADSYDAMTSNRPYRPRLSPTEAVDEIRRCEGTQFYTRISSVLCQLIERGLAEKSMRPSMHQHMEDMSLPLMMDTPWRIDA
jgi:putative nucleotidyltransferase with HDIG domain